MLVSYCKDEFPTDYVPTIFENYSFNVSVDNKNICLGLWDTAGQDEYERLRPLSYQNADIFIICLSVDHKPSLENATQKWYTELQ